MQESLNQRLAANVRAEISARGLKIRALGPALGLTERQVYSRVSGEVRFDLDELPALAAFLGCDLLDLLDREAA